MPGLASYSRHAEHSVWILTQSYTAVLKDFRRQTRWVALFFTPDNEDFQKCLKEKDIIPAEERLSIQATLSSTPHSKLILNVQQPVSYAIL
jgi:hypothetical protein